MTTETWLDLHNVEAWVGDRPVLHELNLQLKLRQLTTLQLILFVDTTTSILHSLLHQLDSIGSKTQVRHILPLILKELNFQVQ